MGEVIAVFIGGGVGSLSRWGLGLLLNSAKWPLGTMVANILGCFLIGLLFRGIENQNTFLLQYKSLLMAGFLGALTTFSTFNLEVFQMMKKGELVTAVGYAMASLVISLVAVYVGYKLKLV